MQIRSLEDMSKAELIALITQEREQAEHIGAGGVSLMGDAKDALVRAIQQSVESLPPMPNGTKLHIEYWKAGARAAIHAVNGAIASCRVKGDI